MMELCDAGHEEICHEGSICPICKVLYSMQKEINKLQGKIYILTEQIEKLIKENNGTKRIDSKP